MAISKTQPMRSAEIELIDASNTQEQTLDAHTQSIVALTDGLGDEIRNRQDADTALGVRIYGEIQARSDADIAIDNNIDAIEQSIGNTSLLDDTIANSIVTLADSAESLESFSNRFKIGLINNIIIPANDSVSTSATFDEAFAADDSCILFAQVITSELASLFTYTLIDCTYSGFSYSIANNDADAHTISLGYIAVKVN